MCLVTLENKFVYIVNRAPLCGKRLNYDLANYYLSVFNHCWTDRKIHGEDCEPSYSHDWSNVLRSSHYTFQYGNRSKASS